MIKQILLMHVTTNVDLCCFPGVMIIDELKN